MLEQTRAKERGGFMVHIKNKGDIDLKTPLLHLFSLFLLVYACLETHSPFSLLKKTVHAHTLSGKSKSYLSNKD